MSPPSVELPYTKGQINRAGEFLRHFRNGTLWTESRWGGKSQPEMIDGLEQAVRVIVEYRAWHQYPLLKANNGVRSMVSTVRRHRSGVPGPPKVSQRLKRFSTIVDKLLRQPEMSLSRMQDIAGCRAVLTDLEELRVVQDRLCSRRPPLRIVDYIGTPRDSGYRGIHVIVQYDARVIEVQLRTLVQHEWAVTVERLGGRMNVDLKSGLGPPEVLAFLQAASEAMAMEEGGEVPGPAFLTRFATLRATAMARIQEGAT